MVSNHEKCAHCGLNNFAGTAECRRCCAQLAQQSPPSAAPQVTCPYCRTVVEPGRTCQQCGQALGMGPSQATRGAGGLKVVTVVLVLLCGLIGLGYFLTSAAGNWLLTSAGEKADKSDRIAPAKKPGGQAKPVVEKEFTIPAPGDVEITASVVPAPEYGEGKKLVVFTPFIDKNDGMLWLSTNHALWSIYGKHRGLLALQDARLEYRHEFGANAVCWQIADPDQKFYAVTVKDTETQKVGAMYVWVE